MRITLVSSCGLVLEQDGSALLIDALNKQFRCYYGLPPEVFAKMLAGEPPYDAVCGVLFTHAHPDHYSASRAEQLRAACGAPVFLPQPNTPERLMMQLGPFTVECSRFPHIPVPGLEEIAHGTPPRHSAWPPGGRGVLERAVSVPSRDAGAAAGGGSEKLYLSHSGRRKGRLRHPPQMRTQHGPLRRRTPERLSAGAVSVEP